MKLKSVRYAVASVVFLLAFSVPWMSTATASASSGQQRPIPATFFGVSVLGITGEIPAWPLSLPVGTLGKTQGTEWNDLEPSNGTYVWIRLDNSISEARSAGITPITSSGTTSASSVGTISGFWLYGVAGVAAIGAIAVMTASSTRSRRKALSKTRHHICHRSHVRSNGISEIGSLGDCVQGPFLVVG